MAVITCKRCKKQVNYQKGTKTQSFLCYACLEKIKMMSRFIEASKDAMPICNMCGKRKSSYVVGVDGEDWHYCQKCKNALDYEFENWEEKEDDEE